MEQQAVQWPYMLKFSTIQLFGRKGSVLDQWTPPNLDQCIAPLPVQQELHAPAQPLCALKNEGDIVAQCSTGPT